MLERYEFFVTGRVAAGLSDLLDEWQADLDEHAGDSEWAQQRAITKDERTRLLRAARTARDTLVAEAAGKVAFIASDKRYTVEKLLEDIASLMSEGVFDELPELARHDFMEGGRALAFELPTAAAFHFLRGTEAVLRDFYCQVVKRERLKEPRMWGPMVAHMRGRKKPPPELLLNNLDSLRHNFRNPTQHPDKVYEVDETQDLLALAIDSINRMVKYQRSLQ